MPNFDPILWERLSQLCVQQHVVEFQDAIEELSSCGIALDDDLLAYFLQIVSANGCEGIVDYLCKLKLNSDESTEKMVNACNGEGWNSLMHAARNGHTSIVGRILKHTTDINHKSKIGATALLCATRSGHFSVVKLLLDEGADVTENVDDEVTPLIVAAQYGYDAIVKQLLEKGCNVNFRSKSAGLTALMLAAANNRVDTVNLLLKMGAGILIINSSNMTVLDIASLKRKKTIYEILLQASECEYSSDHINNECLTEDCFPAASTMCEDIESSPEKTDDLTTSNDLLEADQTRKSWRSFFIKLNLHGRKLKNEKHYKREMSPKSGFKSMISGAASRSAECLRDIHQTTRIASPCRHSTVKKEMSARLESIFPSLDDCDIICMPPGKTLAEKQVAYQRSNSEAKSRSFVTVNNIFYEELKRFSLEDCYRILVKEELDCDSLKLLNEDDVNKLEISVKNRNSLLHMIEYLKVKTLNENVIYNNSFVC